MSRPQREFSSLALSVVLLVLSTLFSMAINIGSFRQTHSSGVMNSYAIPGMTAARLIEQGLRFGKPLNDFYGIEHYLKDVQTSLPDVVHVEVASADGRLLADESGPVSRQLSPQELLRVQRELAKKQQTFLHDADSRLYRLFIAIRPTPGEDAAGFMVVSVKDVGIDQRVASFTDSLSGRVLLIIGAHTALLLALWWFAEHSSFLHRRYRALSLAIVALAQMISAYFGYVQFQDEYLASTRETTTFVAQILGSNFNSLIQRGVHYDQLSGVNEYLAEVKKTAPYLSQIRMEESEAAAESAPQALRSRLPSDATGQSRTLAISISSEVLQSKLLDILFDAAAILLTSLMFMFELGLVVMRRAQARAVAVPAVLLSDLRLRVGSRFSTFLMYFGMFMSASFVPLVMSSFSVPLPGMSLNQSAAAAISAEMAAGSLALLLSNTLSARLGAVRVAYLGYAFLILAALLAWQAPNPVLFLLARAMTGAGSMWVLVSVYRMVNAIAEDEQRQAAIPDILAGSFAGVNCGAVTGSFLAVQIGPQAVFAAAALVLAVSVVYLWQTAAREMGKKAVSAAQEQAQAAPAQAAPAQAAPAQAAPAQAAPAQAAPAQAAPAQAAPAQAAPAQAAPAQAAPAQAAPAPASRRDYLSLALFFLLVSAPTAAVSMYLPYFFPMFAADAGAGPNVIGRAFLINGMCFVFLGPWLAAWARRNLRPTWSVVLSASFLVVGLGIFAASPQLATAFVAVALMSLGDCFGISSQVNFVTSLPLVQRLGRSVVQDMQLNARKAGQAVGPMIFSAVAVFGGGGLGGLGVLMGALLVLFILLSTRPIWQMGSAK